MKVIHVCQRDDPATGGSVRVAAELVRRLPNYGIDSRLLFVYGEPGVFGQQLGDRCHYLGIKNSRQISNFYRWRQYLHQQQPAILHHHEDLLWTQLLTLHHPSYKKVIHVHSGTAKAKAQLPKNRLIRTCQRYSSNAVICITKEAQIRQQNFGFAPDILHVIYNGVDLDRFVPPSPDAKNRARLALNLPLDVPVVGFVGRLHNAMKGCDDFLRVVAALPPKFWGLVAGDGPDFANLQQLAAQLQISDRIRFTGLLPEPLLAYQAIDVFCFTSRHEPFGLTILEAMAGGVPVVGFECLGGSGEILSTAVAAVIPNRNLEAMAAAVQAAYRRDFPWQERLAAARALLAEHFSWQNSAAQLANLYRTL